MTLRSITLQPICYLPFLVSAEIVDAFRVLDPDSRYFKYVNPDVGGIRRGINGGSCVLQIERREMYALPLDDNTYVHVSNWADISAKFVELRGYDPDDVKRLIPVCIELSMVIGRPLMPVMVAGGPPIFTDQRWASTVFDAPSPLWYAFRDVPVLHGTHLKEVKRAGGDILRIKVVVPNSKMGVLGFSVCKIEAGSGGLVTIYTRNFSSLVLAVAQIFDHMHGMLSMFELPDSFGWVEGIHFGYEVMKGAAMSMDGVVNNITTRTRDTSLISGAMEALLGPRVLVQMGCVPWRGMSLLMFRGLFSTVGPSPARLHGPVVPLSNNGLLMGYSQGVVQSSPIADMMFGRMATGSPTRAVSPVYANVRDPAMSAEVFDWQSSRSTGHHVMPSTELLAHLCHQALLQPFASTGRFNRDLPVYVNDQGVSLIGVQGHEPHLLSLDEIMHVVTADLGVYLSREYHGRHYSAVVGSITKTIDYLNVTLGTHTAYNRVASGLRNITHGALMDVWKGRVSGFLDIVDNVSGYLFGHLEGVIHEFVNFQVDAYLSMRDVIWICGPSMSLTQVPDAHLVRFDFVYIEARLREASPDGETRRVLRIIPGWIAAELARRSRERLSCWVCSPASGVGLDTDTAGVYIVKPSDEPPNDESPDAKPPKPLVSDHDAFVRSYFQRMGAMAGLGGALALDHRNTYGVMRSMSAQRLMHAAIQHGADAEEVLKISGHMLGGLSMSGPAFCLYISELLINAYTHRGVYWKGSSARGNADGTFHTQSQYASAVSCFALDLLRRGEGSDVGIISRIRFADAIVVCLPTLEPTKTLF